MKVKGAFKIGGILILVLLLTANVVKAERWGNYHWARTQNPFMVTLGKNVNKSWETALNNATRNWSASVIFDMVVVAGTTTVTEPWI